MRDEWTVGKATCGGVGVGLRVSKAVGGGALDRAGGDRFKLEVWMASVWVAGATLGGGAVCNLRGGGGEVTTGGGGGGEDFSWEELRR